MSYRISIVVVLSVACSIAFKTARADTFERIPSQFGGTFFFDDPNSWTNLTSGGNGVPGKEDLALFDVADTTQFVRMRQDEQSERALVADGRWHLESDGITRHTYSFTPGVDLPDAELDVSGGELTLGSGDGGPVRVDAPEGILFIGVAGDGRVNLVRSGTELNMGGVSRTHAIGDLGSDGVLFIANDSAANIGVNGTLDIGSSNSNATDGSVTVSTDGLLTTGNLNLADRNSDATGSLTLFNNGSRVFQSSSATLNLGSATGGAGTITVFTGGLFGSGGGAQNINATGTLRVGGGTYDGNGLVNLAAGGTILVESGGQFNARSGLNNVAGGNINLVAGQLLVTGGAFTPKAGKTFVYDPGSAQAEFAIGSGGTANLTNGFSAPSGRFLLVDGADVQSSSAEVSGGEVVLQGETTRWSVSGELDLTGSGSTSLVIESGAVLTVSGEAELGPVSGGFSAAPHDMLVTGASSRFNAQSLLAIGRAATSTLRVSDGGSVVGSSFLRLVGSGRIEVTGQGSTLDIQGQSFVSQSFSSVDNSGLQVNNDGEARFADLSVTSASASSDAGRVVVDAAELIATGVLDVGGNTITSFESVGNGHLSIRNGGTVQTITAHIAPTAGSIGEANLSGAGTIWRNTGDMAVGGTVDANGGEGVIHLTDDARLQVDGVLHLRDSGTVRVAGGTLQIDDSLRVHDNGMLDLDGGTLRFNSTTLVNAGEIRLGSGVLNLTDPSGYTVGTANGPLEELIGTNLVALPADVGLSIDQTLFVPAGRSVSTTNTSLSGNTIKNQGLITAISTQISSPNEVTNEGDLVLIDSIVDGALSSEGAATITILGTANFNGMVSGSGDFYGPGVAKFNGGFAPGSSPGLVTFEGDLALGTSNTLLIEIGGTSPGDEHDRIEVAGFAALEGELEVELIDGFTPSLGDNFGILMASGGFDSKFSAIDLPDLTGQNLDWRFNPGGATLFLEVVPALAGDFNTDGVVDAADYTVWRDGLGVTFAQSDYTDWTNNYGATSVSQSNNVPEPAACLLLITAASVPLLRRTR